MIQGNRLNDKYLLWIGIPLLSILYTTAVNLPAVVEENRLWWKQYLTDFSFVFICWMISREIIRLANIVMRLFTGARGGSGGVWANRRDSDCRYNWHAV